MRAIHLKKKHQADGKPRADLQGSFPEDHRLWLWAGFGPSVPAVLASVAAACDILLVVGTPIREPSADKVIVESKSSPDLFLKVLCDELGDGPPTCQNGDTSRGRGCQSAAPSLLHRPSTLVFHRRGCQHIDSAAHDQAPPFEIDYPRRTAKCAG